MSWELASFLIVGAVIVGGFAWYERSRPTSQVVALVAALAALAIAGRIAFAAIPNVKPTTDIVIFAGYALGPAPGFAVGALTALVSNFWFGQGPWTPWQMAGWGLCGILGAVLAVARPRASRLTLAVVCALAGIAYGALLNFSLMATYGGDLSLQRFLALESRAVPFDAAHAIGNATLALIAGPAIVRALVRFRERFEWRAPAVAATLLLALAIATALPSRAAADTNSAIAWLARAQNSDGGWGSSPQSESSASVTCWVMLGLEAAGGNPLDVPLGGGPTAIDFLRSRVGELSSSGDFARTILALEGAGLNPRSFAGHNLVAALAKRRADNGSFAGWPGSTAFAVIALRAAGATGGLDKSTSWLATVQNGDGGWGDVPDSPSTADGTGAVMQAMPDTEAARHGLGFLRKAQRPNGGFALGGSGGVNAQSTAWAVQGIIAVGEDPATVEQGGNSPLDYLAGLQQADGHYRYSSSSDQTPVWVTGQVLAATAGEAFPVSPAPRLSQPKAQSRNSASDAGSVPVPPPAAPKPPAAADETGVAPPAAPPSGGTGVTPAPPPASGGAPSGSPGELFPSEGEEPADAPPPAAPRFEASENPGPKPWAPVGIGLASGGLALGGVLLLGRRFGW